MSRYIYNIRVIGRGRGDVPDLPDFRASGIDQGVGEDTGMIFPVTLSGTTELEVDFSTTVLNAVTLIGLKGRPSNGGGVYVGPAAGSYMAAVVPGEGFIFIPPNWIGASVGSLFFVNNSSTTNIVDVYAWGT